MSTGWFMVPVANDLVFGRRSCIEDQQTVLAVETLRETVGDERVRTSGMRAVDARAALLHLAERRIIETVRTKRVVEIAVGRAHEQLEVVERTLELAVEFDGAVLGQVVRVLAELAVETLRLALDELHEAATLAAPRHRFARGGERRERVLEERVHEHDVLHEEVKLLLEDLERVLEHVAVVGAARRYQAELLLDLRAHLGQAQVRVDALIAVHEHHAQFGGHEAPVALELHVVALRYVVDVHWYGRVRPNAVLLHECDQLALGQIVRRRGLSL